MDDARRVDRDQPFGQSRRQREHRGVRQWPLPLDRVGQRRTGNVRGDQPGHRPVDVGVDHLRGEQAAHLARRRDLTREPGPETGVLGQVRADNLDRDHATAGGASQVDPAHATTAEPPEQHVRSHALGIAGL